jgi:hypothetical protein
VPYLDPVERWIVQTTGRTLDQHAADPIPAAAHLPASVDQLRVARDHLLRTVDELRTLLINADDLTGSVLAVMNALSEISEHTADYESARIHIHNLVGDPDRLAYVATNPVQPVRRRYINPGDTVLIVLPHNEVCRRQQIAGRTVRAHIDESHVELDPDEYPGPVRLFHASAGIYRDPVESRLYHLRATGERRVSSR